MNSRDQLGTYLQQQGLYDHTEIEIARDAWQASRACATPEWEHAPDWAQWLAMDSLGHWWWFELRPEQRSMMWANIWGSRVTEAGRTLGRTGWTETLEPRP